MPEWLHIPLFVLTLFIMLVGLLGLVVPVFPGIVVIWLAALGYGVASGFSTLGIWLFVLITLFMIVGTLIDNVFMAAGSRQGGAAWTSLALGMVAGVAGTFLLPPIGGLITTPLTIFLLEYGRQRDWRKAYQTVRGLAIGWGMAFVVRFGLGVLMILTWLIWHWKG